MVKTTQLREKDNPHHNWSFLIREYIGKLTQGRARTSRFIKKICL